MAHETMEIKGVIYKKYHRPTMANPTIALVMALEVCKATTVLHKQRSKSIAPPRMVMQR